MFTRIRVGATKGVMDGGAIMAFSACLKAGCPRGLWAYLINTAHCMHLLYNTLLTQTWTQPLQ